MASSSHPKILLYKQDGATAIAKGVAVKFGADSKHVTPCTASTDKRIGVAQGASTSAEDFIEVALNGGGGKGLAQTTIARGQMLVPHTDGSLKPTTGSGDSIVAQAMDDAVVGDLVSIEVVTAVATAASQ